MYHKTLFFFPRADLSLLLTSGAAYTYSSQELHVMLTGKPCPSIATLSPSSPFSSLHSQRNSIPLSSHSLHTPHTNTPPAIFQTKSFSRAKKGPQTYSTEAST
jgi:hypothetical protein